MDEDTAVAGAAIGGFIAYIGIAFTFGPGFIVSMILLIFKLLEKTDMGWGWVFSPMWIPAAGFAAIGIIVSLVCLLFSLRG